MKKVLKFILLIFVFFFLISCDILETKPKINSPKLRFKDNVLSYELVDNAYLYVIYVDDLEYTRISTNSLDLSNISEGVHQIKVQALSKDDAYLDSDLSFLRIQVKYQPIIIDEKNYQYQVFMINDTHGALFDDEFPSLGRVASIVDSLDENTIKIHNGDAFQGSYESNQVYGRSVLDALNQIGFDCFVLGNHEFDWGLDVIRQYKDGNLENGEANFPFLGCNIIDKKTNKMVDFLEPYYIKEIDGLKVGIIGMIGYGEESSILTPNVADYDFVYPYELVRQYIKELKEDKSCDSVLLSIHDYDEELNQRFAEMSGIYQIDGILCGHTHQHITKELTSNERKIPVVQNSSQNKTAITIDFNVLDHTYQIKSYYPSSYPMSKTLEEVLNNYQYLNTEAKTIIKKNNNYISRASLGAAACQAMKDEFDADLAIINTGGIRNYINSDITIGAIFTVFPFNNQVIETTLTGSKLLSLYNKNSDYLYFSEFDFNQINNNQIYKIAVIDYVFYGPYYDEFKNIDYVNTGVLMRDLLIEYFKK